MSRERKELPAGWVSVSLRDLGMPRTPNVTPAKAPDRRFELWSVPSFPDDVPEYLLGSEIGSSKQRVEPGDVLLCKINPRLNRVWLVRDPGELEQIASTEWIVLRCPQIMPKFLMYQLREECFRQRLCADVSGVGGSLTRARPKIVGTLGVNVAPLPEQRRIVAKIEELQARSQRAREALEAIPDLIEQFRQSVLAAAFRGDLTAEWREQQKRDGRQVEPASELLKRILAERRKRWEDAELDKLKAKGLTGDKLDKEFAKRRKTYKEPTPPDTTKLPDLPEGWCWVSIEQLALVGTGATPKRSRADYWTGDVPWVTSGALNNARIDAPSQMVSEKALGETNLTLYPPGTLLVAMYGEGKTRGMSAELAIRATTNQAIAAVRTDALPAVVKDWLRLFLQKNYSDARMEATGGVQPNLNLSIVKAFRLPLPPSAEQTVLTDMLRQALGAAGAVLTGVRGNEEALNTLDQAILARAFRGELVPQDPSDEPASTLLERIRQERQTQAKQGKAKRSKKGRKTMKTQRRRRPLLEVLREHPEGITPEQLCQEAGLTLTQIEDFYLELTGLRDRLEELKPVGTEAQAWPHDAQVLLKLEGVLKVSKTHK